MYSLFRSVANLGVSRGLLAIFASFIGRIWCAARLDPRCSLPKKKLHVMRKYRLIALRVIYITISQKATVLREMPFLSKIPKPNFLLLSSFFARAAADGWKISRTGNVAVRERERERGEREREREREKREREREGGREAPWWNFLNP